MTINYSAIKTILAETMRRVDADSDDLCAMMQGVYSTLMVITGDNWPEIRTLLDKAEQEMGIWG